MGYSSSRWLVAVVVLALITFSPPAPAEAISCTQALEFLISCQSFLLGVGEISTNCCVGAQSLAQATVSSADQKIVCHCLKQAALSVKVNQDNAKQLPQLCKIDVPVPVQLNVNCDAIPINDVSFKLNRYKNLESKALRPTKEGHSPGMGHGSPPGAPPQLNRYKNLESKALRPTKEGHSPGMGHGSPPGAPSQLNRYKNLDSKALRLTKEGHSPGMGHGNPPGVPPQLNMFKNLESKALRPTKEGHSPGMGHGSPPDAPPQLNMYKNWESKALRPTKEGHSPGMGHGSPPGAPPHRTTSMNKEVMSKTLI
ncbi:hypothetical protein Salat_0158700 [Sesamum alatum]|uniref:Bifunctional inhibitor/plant lipid transfer protein/seed storage helical domain-containing protein n=1 Tax=Sesamum alatum TaxID=300844 RepID=A0AAE2CXP1_9LAMI|nr:hypothetical protein Salat_0158700 [Sesamum alatum]